MGYNNELLPISGYVETIREETIANQQVVAALMPPDILDVNITPLESQPDIERKTIPVPFKAEDDKPYIFISYSHQDSERVFEIIEELYNDGWRIWYDQGIDIGEDFDKVIKKHISECSLFLMFVTENICKSDYSIRKELIPADDMGCDILFCCLEDEESIKIPSIAADIYDKYKKVKLENLKNELEGVERLPEKRHAEGVHINAVVNIRYDAGIIPEAVAEHDLFEYSAVPDGIAITRYNGSSDASAEITVPYRYKGAPVVELRGLFESSTHPIGVLSLPDSLRRIFGSYNIVQSVKIPKNVARIEPNAFPSNRFIISCEEGTVASYYAQKNGIKCDLRKPSSFSYSANSSYAYVCCAPEDTQSALIHLNIAHSYGAAVCFEEFFPEIETFDLIGSKVQPISNDVKKKIMDCKCFVAFISDKCMLDLYKGYFECCVEHNREIVLFYLNDCEIPWWLEEINGNNQSIKNGSTEEKITSLLYALKRRGCYNPSVSVRQIPKFEYRIGADGLIVTNYIGKSPEVNIHREYIERYPTVGIAGGTFDRSKHSITNVSIPKSVTNIDDNSFPNCSFLASVSLPISFAYRISRLFENCLNLKHISFGNDKKAVRSIERVWSSDDGRIIYSAPSHDLRSYELQDKVEIIGKRAFYGCTSLESIVTNRALANIDPYAFSKCISLKNITLPPSTVRIGEAAFSGCTSLTSIIIPDSVTSIGNRAFCDCSSLTSIIVSDSVKSIGDGTFRGCSSLTSIIIPDSVTSIGDGAFMDCRSLTSVTISDSTTSVGKGAFNDCSSLTGITIPDSAISIGDEAFNGCSSLTGIAIPDNVTSIGIGAFYGCGKITVYCHEESYAWQYCEQNTIRHKPLSAAPAETAVKVTQESTPRKKSPARWLVPILILLTLAVAAGLKLSGLVDILGLLGL